MFNVTMRGHDEPLSVEMGNTILATALGAGVPFPHSCQSGNCGACKVRLISGEVEMSPYSSYALSKAERGDGLILACRAVPWEDCEIAMLSDESLESHPFVEMDCTVAEVEAMTHDIKRVVLTVDFGGPMSFSAGQYAHVTFPYQAPRDYSMANRPDSEQLEFHIRRMGHGGVSDFVFDELAQGQQAIVEGPAGTSYLRADHEGPILAIAGGSGLSAMKSIVETALAEGPGDRPIHLYFGVRDERDLYMTDRFEALAERHDNFNFVPVLSEPTAETGRRTGYVGEAALDDLPDLEGFKIYMAGPPVMVESTTKAVLDRGVARTDIHADAFYTEQDAPEGEAA